MIHPIILCGGSGTRLWPSSRRAYPKQFAPLLGPESLFQQALRRLAPADFAAPLVMTNEAFRFTVTDQMAAVGLEDGQVVLEPEARNTAPAILTAALMLAETPDALMLVMPSDHLIRDSDAFLDAVREGVAAAEAGALVTFGIVPERADTGFGYLRLSAAPSGGGAVPLEAFIEKPGAADAAALFEAGDCLWNAGIFLFRVRDILAAFEAHAPGLVAPCRAAIAAGETDLGFFRLGADYAAAESISIDYAVLEKAGDVVAVPLDAGWSDLGSWDALRRLLPSDDSGVVSFGPVSAVDCENTLLRSEDDNIRLVGLGLKNIAAVAMRDAVLVADLDRAQDVRLVVSALREAGHSQAEDYPRFHRPWGWYETLCLGDRFQVKRIMVKPGGVLSLQSHVHRAEHWVVVSGTAKVTVGETAKLLSENESVYIPLGEVHRMENPGKVPMYLIEVQTGAYLGEDDIIRYEDVYNRG